MNNKMNTDFLSAQIEALPIQKIYSTIIDRFKATTKDCRKLQKTAIFSQGRTKLKAYAPAAWSPKSARRK
jgi:hypothetical protein